MQFDKYFDFFLEEFGQPTSQRIAKPEEIEQYRNVLPDRLLEYWGKIGFAGFKEGLFWITNPADYVDILDRFLDDTLFPDIDTYHVIARSAWGELYLWGEKTGDSLEISPHLNWITTSEGCQKQIEKGLANKKIESFFGFTEPNAVDVDGKDGKPLFERTLKTLGPLTESEVYGFAPYLFTGGQKKLANIQKMDLITHLNLIADMGEMEVIDMAALVGKTLKEHGE
ncbi:GAD-like domain-containing protein [uncultured Shewanella sp.]|uniref:GAD-like domain-containing protein n=1 Tax=uncultured Shewanella sp. TaxID=173975 RepID=UPI002622078C|nr:GAD-like domain-containing protein [uncultured Shewanella sp.]